MKKVLIYGSIFGLVFGLIQAVSIALTQPLFLNLSSLTSLPTFISLFAYIIVLFSILKDEESKVYSKRLLNGFVFSFVSSLIIGIMIVGVIFAQNISKVDNQLLIFIATELIRDIIFTLVLGIVLGAILPSIFAGFIKPTEGKNKSEVEAK